jgi:exopolysaccharide biosynthesis WecB/TagA/CpsF family protein
MKILLVHNGYRHRGGEDSVVAAETRLLRSAGHSVVEYFRSNGEISASSLVQRIQLCLNTVWSTESYRGLKDLIRRERPHVAHFHNTFPLISPVAYAACSEAGIPVVQTVHNYRMICPGGTLHRNGRPCEDCVGKFSSWPGVAHACYRENRPMTSTIVAMNAVHRALGTWKERVGLYVAPSRFARQKLVEGGLPAKKIVVKPHFVAPDPGRRTNPGASAIFAGRLSEEKGLRTLLKAWKLAGVEMPLRIVGDGPLRQELELKCRELGLENVRFDGELSHSETIEAIKAARFAIAPSECYETFSVTIAEAAACGVPAIASRHGALAEMVRDGNTGLLFKPGDPEDLAAAIKWVAQNPDSLAEMGLAARAMFETELTAEQNLPQLLSVYERAGARETSLSVAADQQSDEKRSVPKLLPAICESFSVLGVNINATQIPEVIRQMQEWISKRQTGRMIAVTGMHGVMEAQHNSDFREVLAAADAVVPDGMSLVWLGRLRGFALRRRVYGPELMLAFCEQTVADGYRHFLYGGASGQADKLAVTLLRKFPGLRIVGTHSPPFRPLSSQEDTEICAQINATAPDILWVGLGTPKQELWMHDHRAKLRVPVLIGVGAAFDIHAGTKSQAPEWMRENGLEWFYRLVQEPRRLWKRYLVYGSEFVVRASLELVGVGKKAHAR